HAALPDRVVALQAAELERPRQTQGHGDDRTGVVVLVLVLVKRQARTRLVAIDQARIGAELRIAGLRRRDDRQRKETGRHGRPWMAGLGIEVVVAISGAVG